MKRAAAALAAVALAALWALPARAADDAAALFKAGDFDAAAAAYSAILAAHPDDPDAQLGLGTIQMYRNHIAAAKALLEAAVEGVPDNRPALRVLSQLRRRDHEMREPATIDGDEAIVPFVVKQPLPLIQARVNGRGALLMIDTGTSFALQPEFAAAAGVKLGPPGQATDIGGNAAPGRLAIVDKLELGGAVAANVSAAVLDTRASEAFVMGTRVDGIVGTSVFKRFLTTIDYPHGRLILRPRSASAAFEAKAAAVNATIEPCWFTDDHFIVARARVDNAPARLFVFDSGLDRGLTATHGLIDAAHIAPDAKGAVAEETFGGISQTVPFVAGTVAVGDSVQHAVRGLVIAEGRPFGIFPFTVWGSIGQEFLEHYAYTVDFEAMNVVLVPNGSSA